MTRLLWALMLVLWALPVSAQLMVKKGTTDVSAYFFLVDSTAGTPETGLTITGLDLQYVRYRVAPSTKADATALAATDSAHGDNQCIEIDATDQPGLYRCDFPDAAFATGAPSVVLTVVATGVHPAHLEYQLVDFDPQDTVRLGLTALPNAAADAAGGLTISDAGGLDLDARIGTDIPAILVDTSTTLDDLVDDLESRLGTPSNLGGGATVAANLSDIEGQTDDIGAAGAGLTEAGGTGDQLTALATASALDLVSTRVSGFVFAVSTIGATGNDTTHLHLSTLTYGDDEINNYMLVILDTSASEYHARWIEDWADTGDLATVATLPFTPEASTDLYWLIAMRQDVTGGSGLDAAGVRAAVGLASANLDTQLTAIDDAVDTEVAAILADTGTDGVVLANDAITAAKIAADAIGASEVAASALTKGTEIAGFNDLSAAQVNAEVDTAIVDARLDELVAADSDIDGAAPPTVGSVFHELLTRTTGSFTYDQTTDSLEAVRDNMGTAQTGDSFARLGAPAGASVSADIAAIEAQTDDIGVAGAGLTVLATAAALDAVDNFVDTEVADILNSIVLATGTSDSGSTTTMVDAARTEADADYWTDAAILFTSGNIAGQSRLITDFNATTDTITFSPATTQAVSTQTYEIIPNVAAAGASAPSAADVADAVWDEDIVAAHGTADTAGLIVSQITKRSVTFGTAVVAGSVVDQLADDGTASFDRTTDSLQAIADSGGGGPTAAQIADAVWDEASADHVGAGSTGERIERLDIIASGGAGGLTNARAALLDNLDAAVTTRLAPTTAGRTLDVTATGEAGVDLDNTAGTLAKTTDITGFNDLSAAAVNAEVDTALADVNLDHLVGTATGIPAVPAGTYLDQVMDDGTASFDRTTDSLQAVRDNMGTAQTGDSFARLGAPAGASVSADIAAIEGQTDDIGAAGAGLTAIPSTDIVKNATLSDFEFLMVDSADHITPKTGLTITGQRSCDGAAFTGVTGTIAEVGSGVYQFDAATADTNCNIATWKFSATGADTFYFTFRTRP